MAIFSRLKHAWNAFRSREEDASRNLNYSSGASYGSRPDRLRPRHSGERSIIASIYNRLALDVSSIDIRHVRLDDNLRYVEDIPSGLNYCLTQRANLDQFAQHFRQDIVQSLFEYGSIAIVPVDTDLNPYVTGGYDVKTLRVAKIVGWHSEEVTVRLYKQDSATFVDITLDKSFVAIVENPFYTVMNEPNSTLQRIIRKLNLLDVIDEQSASGRLDLIIQVPYVTKSENQKANAERRLKDIEFQLTGSKYGIAYTDGTEKVIQLNRPVENQLLKQIEYLMPMLYSQLGLTEAVVNGTADESAMINYHNRTIKPLVTAIIEAMRGTFLTNTARAQGQWILPFRDPFSLAPLSTIAEIADKFTRNEIVSSNEIRAGIGLKPSKDPKADELKNSNMPESPPAQPEQKSANPSKLGDGQNERR